MYTLLSGLYRALTQKEEFSVLILGLDNAGKTTFLESAKTTFTKGYRGVNPSKITATVGLNIGNIEADGVVLNFWDLGGQEELQALWDKYYSECHGVIYCVDSNDRDRIQESKKSFDAMISNENLCDIPLLVLANKQDLPGNFNYSIILGRKGYEVNNAVIPCSHLNLLIHMLSQYAQSFCTTLVCYSHLLQVLCRFGDQYCQIKPNYFKKQSSPSSFLLT